MITINMKFRGLLFYTLFEHLFPNLPELKARVFFQYKQAEQDISSGANLLGNLLVPTGGARMDRIVRNQFLTILMYRHLLRHLIGDFPRHRNISKRNRMMTAGVLNHILNQMLMPHVSFVNLKPFHQSCKILQRCAMKVVIHQVPISVHWYNGGFQLTFTYPTCESSVNRRIEQLARPFSRLIDPRNEMWGGNIFVVWALYAKIILDLDDCTRFGLNSDRSVENIVSMLTDDEILAIFSSYEFCTILRKYICLHIQQKKIREIEAGKIRTKELLWEMVEFAMSESYRRERFEYSEQRRSKFNDQVVQSFVRLVESSSMILRQAGFEYQMQDLMEQINVQQMDPMIFFPFIAPNVLMKLQDLISVFFSMHHQFEVDLNELTFLVVWTAVHNLRSRRRRLIYQSKPWLQKSDWSEKQLLSTASPELLLFFATTHNSILLMKIIQCFSDKKRQERPK
jgi:hypothetical protein